MCCTEKSELSKEDKIIIEFLSKYRIMAVEHTKEVYKTEWYFRKRINRLVEMGYLRKFNYYYIVLGKEGRKMCNLVGKEYIKNTANKPYMERLKAISDIGTISINSNIKFIPSWKIKNKKIYTDTARKYYGELVSSNKKYVVYYLLNKKEITYIKQIIFDINKTINYDKLILFVDDYTIISKMFNYFIFDKKEALIIKYTKENKELIKKCNDIDFHEIIQTLYNEIILISDWEIADYVITKKHYIVNMLFLDTTKVSEINWFYKENANSEKRIDVLTLEENKELLKNILTDKCNIITLSKEILLGGSENEEFLFEE